MTSVWRDDVKSVTLHFFVNMGIISNKRKKLLLLATSMSIMAKIRRKKKRSCGHAVGLWGVMTEVWATHLFVKWQWKMAQNIVQCFGWRREADFDYLPNLVSPLIAKQDTLLQTSISARERLEVTLRYLATGMSKPLGKPSYMLWFCKWPWP